MAHTRKSVKIEHYHTKNEYIFIVNHIKYLLLIQPTSKRQFYNF